MQYDIYNVGAWRAMPTLQFIEIQTTKAENRVTSIEQRETSSEKRVMVYLCQSIFLIAPLVRTFLFSDHKILPVQL